MASNHAWLFMNYPIAAQQPMLVCHIQWHKTAALEPAIYIPHHFKHHLKLRQVWWKRKGRDLQMWMNLLNCVNYLHIRKSCQYVKGKVATIHSVGFFPPKFDMLKLILYQFPGVRHYISPGRPIGTTTKNPSKTDWVQVPTCDLSI